MIAQRAAIDRFLGAITVIRHRQIHEAIRADQACGMMVA
jgi:hypothetical protein